MAEEMKNGFLLFALSLAVLLAGCTSGATGPAESGNPSGTGGGEDIAPAQPATSASLVNVEVIHFHGTNQCYSCITMGAYAEETINTYFSKELGEGTISFAHINGELAENREKVVKYGATGSSLFIGVYNDGGFSKEENIMVWYKIGNKEEYMKYLKGVLEKKLQGA